MRLTAQKNALLKSYDITPNGGVLLDTYDEQLAEYGALIMDHRCKFLAAAAPIAAQDPTGDTPTAAEEGAPAEEVAAGAEEEQAGIYPID